MLKQHCDTEISEANNAVIQMTRDDRFDNLKGVMIFLVLFCHYIEKMYASWQEDLITRYLYYFIYLFHMPVFIFISGYFSKKNNSDVYYKKTISSCLIPYILFNFIYSLAESRGDIWTSLLEIIYPQWTLWFLLSLFQWRILVKPVSMFRSAFALSVLFSSYLGFIDLGSFLGLARTFNFLPFFLAGYLIPERYIEKIRGRKKACAFLAFAFATNSFIAIQKFDVGFSALYMATPYYGMSGIASIGARILILTTGLVCVVGFISIISEKHSVITTIGKNSILVYLVHSGIIRALTGVSAVKVNNGLVNVVFAIIFSAIICLLFGNDPIAKIYRSVMDRVSNLFIKKNGQVSN